MQHSERDCKVCQLVSRLLQEGAERVSLSDLCEQGCQLHVQASADDICVHSLLLDVQGAEYRFIAKGHVTRMCDFSVLAARGESARLIVVEIKSGMAYVEDIIEQVSQGLRVLHERFQENGLKAKPRAFFVVGREADKLRWTLRGQHVYFGTTRVPWDILECGGTIPL